MFRSMRNTGFHMEFSNGYAISCQFSVHSYCSRRDLDLNGDKAMKDRMSVSVESEDCEVAILKGQEFVTEDILEAMGSDLSTWDDMVMAYVSADDVGKIISYLVNLKD